MTTTILIVYIYTYIQLKIETESIAKTYFFYKTVRSYTPSDHGITGKANPSCLKVKQLKFKQDMDQCGVYLYSYRSNV